MLTSLLGQARPGALCQRDSRHLLRCTMFLCVPRSTSLSPIGPWSLPFSFGTLVETLSTMILDPPHLFFPWVAEDLLSIVRHDLLCRRVEEPFSRVVRSSGKLRTRFLIGQQCLASRLQTLQDLRIEASVTLRHILPIAVFIQKAVVENVATLDGVTALPCGLKLAVRINKGSLSVKLTLAELALIHHAIGELETTLAFVPLVFHRTLVPSSAPSGHGQMHSDETSP
mmetsp:Transcript_50574/g.134588  ORF Transcript_50574/g.134588 Transcript_50574/m.134588 type:complete len:227 (+) Transcript_50574:255-935(+)